MDPDCFSTSSILVPISNQFHCDIICTWSIVTYLQQLVTAACCLSPTACLWLLSIIDLSISDPDTSFLIASISSVWSNCFSKENVQLFDLTILKRYGVQLYLLLVVTKSAVDRNLFILNLSLYTYTNVSI